MTHSHLNTGSTSVLLSPLSSLLSSCRLRLTVWCSAPSTFLSTLTVNRTHSRCTSSPSDSKNVRISASVCWISEKASNSCCLA
jgi:hypothetical protein